MSEVPHAENKACHFQARREQLKSFKDIYLKAKARIWP